MRRGRGQGRALAWLGTALAAWGSVGPLPAGAETRWTMPSEYPASTMPGEALVRFGRELSVATGGTITVEPKPEARDGLTAAGIIEAVAAGRLTAGDSFAGPLGQIDPLFELSSLPFAVRSLEEAHRLADMARPAYAEALAARGLHLAYLVPWPASGIWSKAALEAPGDVARLSIRTYDETSTRVFAAAGAKAVAIRFADLAGAFEAGSINAVLSSGDGGAGRRLWEVLPTFTAVNYAFPLSFGLINAKAYAALPDAERLALDMAGAETERAMWTLVGTRLAANYDVMRRNGVAIVTEPAPAVATLLADSARAATDEWRRRTPQGAALLDAVRPR